MCRVEKNTNRTEKKFVRKKRARERENMCSTLKKNSNFFCFVVVSLNLKQKFFFGMLVDITSPDTIFFWILIFYILLCTEIFFFGGVVVGFIKIR